MHEFELNARQKDGSTLRENLESVYRQTGNMPKQLEPVEMPDCLHYLWSWFCELSGGRGYAEFGALPLTYSEIKAWAELTKTEPTAWEIEALKRIDRAYLTESNKK